MKNSAIKNCFLSILKVYLVVEQIRYPSNKKTSNYLYTGPSISHIMFYSFSLFHFLWFSVYCVVLQKRSLKNLKANCVSPSHVHLIIGEFDSAQCFYFSKKIAIFGNRNSVYEFGVKLGISDRFWWTNFWFKWAWSSTFQVNISLWLWGNFGANRARIC